ncbi:LOW QUALITY PROTEIN: hypothetical protein QTO34_005671 [Cnephaeus nilssonii]|uniref:DNA helicase Pif1-like 2B domain-containing protein n=1 Tax=Cnephaeus nilssonii TaxID=3371016 RepID=A0AA40LK64_CNENI|nr:LOW QUALITY PROTEIN: hypothetical protein QTO34_005671 [Eptesicus nilssonii]
MADSPASPRVWVPRISPETGFQSDRELVSLRAVKKQCSQLPATSPIRVPPYLSFSALTLKLTTNMRVQLQNDRSPEIFSHQLLEIGNRKVPVDLTSGRIPLPHNFCNLVTSKEELVEKVFPNIQTNYKNHDWLSERAILAAKNKDVYELNNIIQSNIQSEAVTYKSVDTVVEADEAVNYLTEFLNSLNLPGMPLHVLQLKIGVPIIMLRNINQPKLCNGTLLAVKKLMSKVDLGNFCEDVLISRIPMIPTDMPFQFKRLQFPIRLAFAITINKAQGQSLELCGLDLDTDCFSHGQLYVAYSRVGKPDNLSICTDNGTTKNIVYSQALMELVTELLWGASVRTPTQRGHPSASTAGRLLLSVSTSAGAMSSWAAAAAAVAAAADSAQWLSVKEETIFLQDGPIRVTDLAELPSEILGAPGGCRHRLGGFLGFPVLHSSPLAILREENQEGSKVKQMNFAAHSNFKNTTGGQSVLPPRTTGELAEWWIYS